MNLNFLFCQAGDGNPVSWPLLTPASNRSSVSLNLAHPSRWRYHLKTWIWKLKPGTKCWGGLLVDFPARFLSTPLSYEVTRQDCNSRQLWRSCIHLNCCSADNKKLAFFCGGYTHSNSCLSWSADWNRTQDQDLLHLPTWQMCSNLKACLDVLYLLTLYTQATCHPSLKLWLSYNSQDYQILGFYTVPWSWSWLLLNACLSVICTLSLKINFKCSASSSSVDSQCQASGSLCNLLDQLPSPKKRKQTQCLRALRTKMPKRSAPASIQIDTAARSSILHLPASFSWLALSKFNPLLWSAGIQRRAHMAGAFCQWR